MTNEEKILEALSEIKAAILENKAAILENKTAILENKSAILENKREITRTNMRLENEIIPQLHLLAEGHNMLIQTLAPRSRVDELEEKVQTLEFAVKMVNAELQRMKKAQ